MRESKGERIMETPTDRAALLGTEHGTQAAKAWWPSWSRYANQVRFLVEADAIDELDPPQPDLSGDDTDGYAAWDLAHDCYGKEPGWNAGMTQAECWTQRQSCVGAYETAFRAAVESTIRQAVQAD